MAAAKSELISDEMSERIIEVAKKLVVTNGANNITVSKILSELGITNRVFYNRFHNIDEILEIIYKNTIHKIRECIPSKFDENRDFFEQVTEIVVNTLILSYDMKMQFNQYVFEHDSLTESNREWWTNEIRRVIDYAKAHNYIDDSVDSEMLSHTIWCFFRGYNADAVSRKLSMEDAVKYYKYGINFLFKGLKK